MNEKLKPLEEILREYTFKQNPVNTMEDIDNLKVLVWTFAKTGTSTLASSFQHCMDKALRYKNVTHSHSEACWYKHISPKLKEIDFSFEFLIEFINSKGIKPLIIQSYRPPIARAVSELYHLMTKENHSPDDMIVSILDHSNNYINYLKNTFKGIWTHTFDKQKRFGFQEGENYNILYTTIEGINDLPKNIQSIQQLKDYHNLKIQTTNQANSPTDYADFKSNLKLNEEWIDKLYNINSEPLNFFYNSSAILDMKNTALEQYSK